jgi:hypothetical protein
MRRGRQVFGGDYLAAPTTTDRWGRAVVMGTLRVAHAYPVGDVSFRRLAAKGQIWREHSMNDGSAPSTLAFQGTRLAASS